MEYESLYQSLRHQCLECAVEQGLVGDEFAASALFKFSADYSGFEGHFPSQPVLPAIVQVAAVRYVAEQLLAQPLYPSSYNRVKFRAIVLPEEIIKLHVQLKCEGRGWGGRFSLHKLDDGEKEIIANGNCSFLPLSDNNEKL